MVASSPELRTVSAHSSRGWKQMPLSDDGGCDILTITGLLIRAGIVVDASRIQGIQYKRKGACLACSPSNFDPYHYIWSPDHHQK